MQPGEYLNDTIIDFYLKYTLRQFLDSQAQRGHTAGDRTQPQFTFVNTFFYTKLRSKRVRGFSGTESEHTLALVRSLRKWSAIETAAERRSIFALAAPATETHRDGEGDRGSAPTYLVIPVNEQTRLRERERERETGRERERERECVCVCNEHDE